MNFSKENNLNVKFKGRNELLNDFAQKVSDIQGILDKLELKGIFIWKTN